MRKLAVATFCLILIGSLSLVEADNNDDVANIKRQVATYYSHEKAKNWGKTYALRTPEFRARVPLETYVETMRRDSQGWQLKESRVIEVSQKGDRAVVKMRFVEEPPADFLANMLPIGKQSRPKLKEMVFKENTVWVSVDGIWYCSEAGSRMHLSLNHAITDEEVKRNGVR